MANEVLIKKAIQKYLVELKILQSEYPDIEAKELLASNTAIKIADAWNEKLLKIGDAMVVPMEDTVMAPVYKELFKLLAIAARTKGKTEMIKAMRNLRNQMQGDFKELKAKSRGQIITLRRVMIAATIGYAGYKLLRVGMKAEERHKVGEPGGNHAPRVR